MKKTCLLLALVATSPFGLSSLFAGPQPTPTVTVVPLVSEALATSPGEVELLITLNRHGYVTKADVKKSTNPELTRPCLAAIRQWRYTAPTADAAVFVQPFRFGGDTIDTTPIANTRPRATSKVSPVLNDEIAEISGEVTVAVAIDANGAVSQATIAKSSHEELNATCLAAAKQWTFKPATEHGRAIASNVFIPFRFIGAPGTSAKPEKTELVDNNQLIPLRQPSPALPEELASLTGEVSLALTVDAHGFVVAATVLSSTQPALAEIAHAAVLQWKFKPIVHQGVAVTVRAIQPVKFGAGAVSVAAVDQLPSLRHTVSPELPAELQGVSGTAHAMFDVDATGHVLSVTVSDTSHEAFKAAILAVAKSWTFHPALRGGIAVEARVSVPFIFGSKLSAN